MSYQTKTIGTRPVIMEYRILTVQGGDPSPAPAAGYTVDAIGSSYGVDFYIEYKISDGPITLA